MSFLKTSKEDERLLKESQVAVTNWNKGLPPVAKLATVTELALWICVIVAAVEIPNH
jgi:hypothetical protein